MERINHEQSPEKVELEDDIDISLGDLLKMAREAQNKTLRQSENETGISNAYLSQIETGKIKQPSPNLLYKLSCSYNLPYDILMEKAGHIVPKDPQSHSRSLTDIIFSSMAPVTEQEAEALRDYLAFLRRKKP